MEEYQSIAVDNKEKVLEYYKSIIKAVEKTRSVVVKCEKETKEMKVALDSGDNEYMRSVLQKYIHKYRTTIDSAPNIKLLYIRKDIYEQITIEDLKNQLMTLIGFVYDYEAKKSVAKETIKMCLKKILQQTGKFSKQEIEILVR